VRRAREWPAAYAEGLALLTGRTRIDSYAGKASRFNEASGNGENPKSITDSDNRFAATGRGIYRMDVFF
jgi:hypothetical protein